MFRVIHLASHQEPVTEEQILAIDDRFPELIRAAIAAETIWLAMAGDEPVAYITADTHFFEHAFIRLLMVRPEWRRRGVASALIEAVEAWSPTEKLFTSTNESNLPMQALLARLGFSPSGRIENLDEGDPELIYIKWVR